MGICRASLCLSESAPCLYTIVLYVRGIFCVHLDLVMYLVVHVCCAPAPVLVLYLCLTAYRYLYDASRPLKGQTHVRKHARTSIGSRRRMYRVPAPDQLAPWLCGSLAPRLTGSQAPWLAGTRAPQLPRLRSPVSLALPGSPGSPGSPAVPGPWRSADSVRLALPAGPQLREQTDHLTADCRTHLGSVSEKSA